MRQRAPRLRSSGSSIVVTHEEFITDIISTNANYQVRRYDINPGQAGNFPWLANLASNYESYKFRDLKYKYMPIAPTSTPGKVMIGVDYDVADASPTSKVVLNSYDGTVSSSVWDTCVHHSTKSNLLKFGVQRYVRTAAYPAGTDPKTYDIGSVYVATSNTPSTSTTCGELWVSYTVELFTPQLVSSIASTLQPTVKTPVQQYARISVSAANVASLVSNIYGDQTLFYIGQQSVDGGLAVVDLLLNPAIKDPFLCQFYCDKTGAVWGKPGDASATGGTFSAFYDTGLGNDLTSVNFWPNGSGYAREWIGTISPLNLFTGSNIIPSVRLRLPPSSTTRFNVLGMLGLPTDMAPVLQGAAAGLPGLTQQPLDWNLINPFASGRTVLEQTEIKLALTNYGPEGPGQSKVYRLNDDTDTAVGQTAKDLQTVKI